MSRDKRKEYIFSNTVLITEETSVMANSYEEAQDTIEDIYETLTETTLDEPFFPTIENPLLPIMEDTPITPTTLNLPSIDQSVMTKTQAANQFSNLTMDQKIRLLFPNG